MAQPIEISEGDWKHCFSFDRRCAVVRHLQRKIAAKESQGTRIGSDADLQLAKRFEHQTILQCQDLDAYKREIRKAMEALQKQILQSQLETQAASVSAPARPVRGGFSAQRNVPSEENHFKSSANANKTRRPYDETQPCVSGKRVTDVKGQKTMHENVSQTHAEFTDSGVGEVGTSLPKTPPQPPNLWRQERQCSPKIQLAQGRPKGQAVVAKKRTKNTKAAADTESPLKFRRAPKSGLGHSRSKQPNSSLLDSSHGQGLLGTPKSLEPSGINGKGMPQQVSSLPSEFAKGMATSAHARFNKSKSHEVVSPAPLLGHRNNGTCTQSLSKTGTFTKNMWARRQPETIAKIIEAALILGFDITEKDAHEYSFEQALNFIKFIHHQEASRLEENPKSSNVTACNISGTPTRSSSHGHEFVPMDPKKGENAITIQAQQQSRVKQESAALTSNLAPSENCHKNDQLKTEGHPNELSVGDSDEHKYPQATRQARHPCLSASERKSKHAKGRAKTNVRETGPTTTRSSEGIQKQYSNPKQLQYSGTVKITRPSKLSEHKQETITSMRSKYTIPMWRLLPFVPSIWTGERLQDFIKEVTRAWRLLCFVSFANTFELNQICVAESWFKQLTEKYVHQLRDSENEAIEMVSTFMSKAKVENEFKELFSAGIGRIKTGLLHSRGRKPERRRIQGSRSKTENLRVQRVTKMENTDRPCYNSSITKTSVIENEFLARDLSRQSTGLHAIENPTDPEKQSRKFLVRNQVCIKEKSPHASTQRTERQNVAVVPKFEHENEESKEVHSVDLFGSNNLSTEAERVHSLAYKALRGVELFEQRFEGLEANRGSAETTRQIFHGQDILPSKCSSHACAPGIPLFKTLEEWDERDKALGVEIKIDDHAIYLKRKKSNLTGELQMHEPKRSKLSPP